MHRGPAPSITHYIFENPNLEAIESTLQQEMKYWQLQDNLLKAQKGMKEHIDKHITYF